MLEGAGSVLGLLRKQCQGLLHARKAPARAQLKQKQGELGTRALTTKRSCLELPGFSMPDELSGQ